MDIWGRFSENFFSTMRMLSENPDGDFLEMPSGTFACATGLPFPGENYAVFSASSTNDDIHSVLAFFKSRKLPFLVPQFPGLRADFCEELHSLGLTVRQNYTAMSIDVVSREYQNDNEIFHVLDDRQKDGWADTVWTGFGGETPAPVKFRSLTYYLATQSQNSLYSLNNNGNPACSGLLHKSKYSCGLYYFATLSEFRRQGFANRLMRHLVWQASFNSDKLFLLATEMGLPFYRNFGFRHIAQIPIRSMSESI